MLARIVVLLLASLLASQPAMAICLFGIGSCNELTRDIAAALLLKNLARNIPAALIAKNLGVGFEIFPRSIMSMSSERVVASIGFQKHEIQAATNRYGRYIIGSDAEASEIRAQSDPQRPVADQEFLKQLDLFRVFLNHGLLVNVVWKEVPVSVVGFREPVFELSAVPVFDDSLKEPCDLPKAFCFAVAGFWFDGVTGITGTEIEKTIQFKVVRKPTPLGAKLGNQIGIELRTAKAIKYDDGWRLME